MRQINLLPWREARRKQQKRAFGIVAGVALVAAGAVVGGVHLYFSHQIDTQNGSSSGGGGGFEARGWMLTCNGQTIA